MSASLVGSEMCIRDRLTLECRPRTCAAEYETASKVRPIFHRRTGCSEGSCLLYTSDAADDM
eukprot:9593649-Alexandrium_andersonii.AAC.1